MSFNSSKVYQGGDWAFTQNPSANREVITRFGNVTSVSSAILTTILSYTVPVGKSTFLSQIEVSGSNIATYEIYIDSVLNARQRTNFGAELNAIFNFETATSDTGYKLLAGSVIQIKVIHPRPYVGDFEARLLAIEET